MSAPVNLEVKRPILSLMCGFPRSGKSTWIKNHSAQAVVVCLDVIRKEVFGHQFHGPAEPFVMGIAKSMVRIILRQKKSVIVDATNVRRSWRHEWESLAEECGARVQIIFIDTPFEVCMERNRRSKRGERVPPAKLREMAERFDNPLTEPDKDSKGRPIWLLHVTEAA